MEQKKSVLFIANPISGNTGKELILKAIDEQMDRTKFDWDIAMTAYPGHGAVLATMASENGKDIVVAIGGDGTVNEIARSLVHTSTALGIIPCGSGNGLARHLQIPLDYQKAIQLINEDKVSALDYGTINNRPFFCTCGMGFDAFVSFKFASSVRRGLLTYMENALMGIRHYKPETYIIEDEDGQYTHKAFLITCANASQYGNNAYIAPQASMSDGLMDVTVMEPFTVVEAPQLAYQLFNGTLTNKGRIKMFKSKKLHIIREHEGVIHCDGDPFKAGKEIEVELFPKKLNVIISDKATLKPTPIMQTIYESFTNMNSAIGQGILQMNKDILRKLHSKF